MRTKNPGEYLVFNEVAPVDDTETFTFHINEPYQRLPCLGLDRVSVVH